MCIYACLWDGVATGTWKGRGKSKGPFEVLESVAGTRLENFEGTPERSERKPESRTSLEIEDTARDSFSANVEKVGKRGDRHEQMIFTVSPSSPPMSVTSLIHLRSTPFRMFSIGGWGTDSDKIPIAGTF